MNTYPGDYAVPGSIQPGLATPGQPLGGGVLPCAHGPTEETLIYPDYADALTGHTLTVVPPGGAPHLIRPVNWTPGGPWPYYPTNWWSWHVVAAD